MSSKSPVGKTIFSDAGLEATIDGLVSRVTQAASELEVRPPLTDAPNPWAETAAQLRGRSLFFHTLIGSGIGRGPLVECTDGAVRYDFITGIGVHFFGHSDPDLLRTAVRAGLQDTIQQGNLHMNEEVPRLLETLVGAAPDRLKHAWLATSGADANENALKVVRAARQPAHMLVAFEHCFAGRTTTMAEVTDNPAYRNGQVVHGDVLYVPFYDPSDPGSIQKSVKRLEEHLHRYEGRIAAFMFELVQGEGGFNGAPPAFFKALMEVCRNNDVLVWADEIQTFGRTTEMFATQALGLDELVDVITVGKLLQGAATLFTTDINPQPGLLSGTFVGTTVALATGRRMLERLVEGDYYGPEGRIAQIERVALETLTELAEGPCKGNLAAFGAIGSMIWLQPFDGSKARVMDVVRAAYDEGVITFFTGHGPHKLRLLLPAGVITDDEVRDGLERIGRAINSCAR